MRGSLRFGTLAYYRCIEDKQVRGDRNEGGTAFSPARGVLITKEGTDTPVLLEGYRVESDTKVNEIFVCCLSKSISKALVAELGAVAYVEITDVRRFCARVTSALEGATLGGKPGRERVGRGVEYYDPDLPFGSRWAVPDLIASAKLNSFRRQDEFRLLYSRTGALNFQNVSMQIIRGELPLEPPLEPTHEFVDIGNIEDIASLRVL